MVIVNGPIWENLGRFEKGISSLEIHGRVSTVEVNLGLKIGPKPFNV